MENIVSIVGTFLTIMLGVNAFFLRGIFVDLGDVKINMAEIFENSKGKEESIKELKKDLKALESRVRLLEVSK
jgi:hypothetical protein